jgi:hypothetical protein
MGINYQEFKEYVSKRQINNFKEFAYVIKNVEEFYDEKEFKFFYPKNIYNDKQTELLFILENGYFLFTMKDGELNYNYNHYFGKIISKKLECTRHETGNHVLTISYDNGNNLILNNLEDSNSNWEADYSRSIRALFKSV